VRVSDSNLQERIAKELGWSLSEVQSFSYQSLRDLVRPVSQKLANELTLAINGSLLVK
jgi:hypothetical protein